MKRKFVRKNPIACEAAKRELAEAGACAKPLTSHALDSPHAPVDLPGREELAAGSIVEGVVVGSFLASRRPKRRPTKFTEGIDCLAAANLACDSASGPSR